MFKKLYEVFVIYYNNNYLIKLPFFSEDKRTIMGGKCQKKMRNNLYCWKTLTQLQNIETYHTNFVIFRK